MQSPVFHALEETSVTQAREHITEHQWRIFTAHARKQADAWVVLHIKDGYPLTWQWSYSQPRYNKEATP